MRNVNCKCAFKEVLQFINSKVMDNHNYINLDAFETTLESNDINTLNKCLASHGFKGLVEKDNNSFVYIN